METQQGEHVIIPFIADSGSTQNLIRNDRYLINKVNLYNSKRISCANNNESADIIVRTKGDLQAYGENNMRIDLKDVLFVPTLSENLLLLRKLAKDNLQVILDKNLIQAVESKSNKTFIMGSYDQKF